MSLIGTILIVFGIALVVAVLINMAIQRYFWRDFEKRHKRKD